MSVEDEFHETLLRLYKLAGRETGYWGNYFLRELRKKGGLATAKRLLLPLKSSKSSPGLQAIIDAGRPELSVEAACLQPQFRSLFTEEELSEAERRLDSLPAYVKPRSVSPSENFSGELNLDSEFTEGARKRVLVNAYERDPKARAACVAKFGYRCVVCEMNFVERYGDIGKQFIHVHHKLPLAARRAEYKVRPTRDLVPVCPNCHAMLHATEPPLSIETLREYLVKAADT